MREMRREQEWGWTKSWAETSDGNTKRNKEREPGGKECKTLVMKRMQWGIHESKPTAEKYHGKLQSESQHANGFSNTCQRTVMCATEAKV